MHGAPRVNARCACKRFNISKPSGLAAKLHLLKVTWKSIEKVYQGCIKKNSSFLSNLNTEQRNLKLEFLSHANILLLQPFTWLIYLQTYAENLVPKVRVELTRP